MKIEELNKQQQKAVKQIEGPVLILAGAGSGKTMAMTHRIAYMVEQGIPAWKILAVTFTNKAAGEMRDRVEALIGNTDHMWILTFHSMCLRILRMYPDRIGYDKNFVIYDTTDQKTLIKNICKEQNISEREYKPQYFLSIISSCKEKGMDPEAYRRDTAEDYRTRIVYQVYKAYRERLLENNAMDFDDLLFNCLRLLQSDQEVLVRFQDRFQYIMVDEYQDTNQVQYELIRLLAENHHNVCVVGDDDQCIYEWRGADIRNILEFEKDYPEAVVIKLEQNYRSKGNILAAAHSVIRNNSERKSKKLWTTAEDGEKIHYIRTENDKDEANYVARQIAIMAEHGRALTDFAILYRTNSQSRLFEQSLTFQGIPYRVLSGMRYYDRKEIKDVLAYMRLVVNPKDDLSLQRIINVPKRGMGAKTVEKTAAFARLRGQSMLEALHDPDVLDTLPNRAYASVKEMVECLSGCRSERENMTVTDIYNKILNDTGYLKALEDERTLESEGRIDNIMDFKSVIAEYEASDENPTIEGFMEQLTLAAEVDNYDETQDTVTLMTLHSAKGLEFPVVFMPGMEDGLFPGSKAFDSDDGMEEERRLCYVGMTRAKEVLFLLSAELRTRYGRTEYTRESQFLQEIDSKLLTGDAVYRRRDRTSLGVSTGSFDGFAEEPFQPYDALKYARMETKRSDLSGTGGELASGDRVKHNKFGEGLVIDTDGSTVTVIFDSVGLKKLALGFAPLKKV